jgi:hypothetical protein
MSNKDNNVLYLNLNKSFHKKKGKYIVFDVDETLGYFSQLGAFIDAISFYNKDFSGSIFERFNEIMDLYPEFIRPKVIEILRYVYKKKMSGECDGVFIYTNNQGPRIWVEYIAKYFDYKLNIVERNYGKSNNDRNQLFDKIIAAYMINGKVVEPGRTTQNKTYDDLLRVTGISPQAEVCFVDDLNHPDMRHENVLYLNIKPYVKTLPVAELIQRYLKSSDSKNIASRDIKQFSQVILERMGSIKNQNNISHIRLDLHDSNYISLNTPFDSTSLKEDIEYKKSGDKLFYYIKLFLKIKQHSNRGTKIHTLNDSRTRRYHRVKHDKKDYDERKIRSNVLTQTQTRKNKNNKRLNAKTRRIGKIMRV